MRSLFIVLLFAALAMAMCTTFSVFAALSFEDLENYTFEKYITDFGKQYGSHEEHHKRRKVFNDNLAEVIAFNKVPGRSYQLGVNHFSDLTKEEFKARYNGLASTRLPSEEPHTTFYALSETRVPDAFTWQDAKSPVLTAVKDQGDCGSCWAHAATESLESMHAIHTGELLTLSTQQITSCVNNTKKCGGTGGCGGATVEVAWDYVKRAGGITLDKDYPYNNGNTNITKKCMLNNTMPRVVKVAGYVTLPRNDYNAVIQALLNKGPLAVSVDASGWSSYSGGIFDACGVGGANISIDHAVQLVGYGTDNITKKDYWIVRNSWTSKWGENGYIRLLRKKTEDICVYDNNWTTEGGGCANESNVPILACGMCGILFDVAYPEVVYMAERGKALWIAGGVFGGLAVLMICLVIWSKCRRTKKLTDVHLLDEGEITNKHFTS